MQLLARLLRAHRAAHAAAGILLILAWAAPSHAVNVPVLSVSVNGGPALSLENEQVCDGTKAVTCVGTGAVDDLLISTFELTADPDPYVTGAFNFYNGAASTLSVVATVIFPMVGTFASPDLAVGTGIVNNVFGGGLLDLRVEGFIDSFAAPVLGINGLGPGVPFSVCDDLGADPGCQNSIVGLTLAEGGPINVDILSFIGLRLSFDLTADTAATIGLDPDAPFAGAAFLSITPMVVPVPAAAWLFLSGVAATAGLRRFSRTGGAA